MLDDSSFRDSDSFKDPIRLPVTALCFNFELEAEAAKVTRLGGHFERDERLAEDLVVRTIASTRFRPNLGPMFHVGRSNQDVDVGVLHFALRQVGVVDRDLDRAPRGRDPLNKSFRVHPAHTA